ncbi:MAG: hypothetical protein J6Z27_00345 [Bacteroidales bacterium]|nr:hypothetical protein [Bacteroidales bacterium]
MSISLNSRIILLGVILVLFSGCEKFNFTPYDGTDVSDYGAKQFLYNVYMTDNPEVEKNTHMMTGYYYWSNQVQQRDFNLNESVQSFFDGILYPKDKWSFVLTADEWRAKSEGIVYGTFGASFGQPFEYYGYSDIKVRFVYPGSPFDEKGITRGWTLTHIDGTPWRQMSLTDVNNALLYPTVGRTYNFTFIDLQGEEHIFPIAPAATLNTRSSLLTTIFNAAEFPDLNNDQVGYFHYLSFKENMIEDVLSAMLFFKRQGIKKLILDLRYNQGGDGEATHLLANLLASSEANGKVFSTKEHNKKFSKYNSSDYITFSQDYSLDLTDLYIITGYGSASASEVLLNGLKPLMNVKCVGDTTYGKPTGMYSLMFPGDDYSYAQYQSGNYSNLRYVFYPICFYNVNSIGEKIPETGIVPDNYRPDDLFHDFGVEEDNIRACLFHIAHNVYPDLPPLAKSRGANYKILKISEENINKNYGIHTIKF